jgi:hypothetical protein
VDRGISFEITATIRGRFARFSAECTRADAVVRSDRQCQKIERQKLPCMAVSSGSSSTPPPPCLHNHQGPLGVYILDRPCERAHRAHLASFLWSVTNFCKNRCTDDLTRMDGRHHHNYKFGDSPFRLDALIIFLGSQKLGQTKHPKPSGLFWR